ncbi:MAG TPA: HNH nuclease [Bacteroidales bacterium]|nr:HNH nuclease [Bacteroidales bacterium]
MLLCPSGNRAKSWACEHCENWVIKDKDMCENCYYAHPEGYLHIAGEQERKIDIVFKNGDIEIYELLKEKADKENISIQDAFKIYFRNK